MSRIMSEKNELFLDSAEILTTTVGSFSQIDWLHSARGSSAVVDATDVVFQIQHRAGIDLPTDGELYRYDPDHPDTNGMIEYFISRMGGITTKVGLSDAQLFQRKAEMRFRRKPAGVVNDQITEGHLDLKTACEQSAAVAPGPFKFTLTSPYMLARTLLDKHYNNFENLTLALADVLAEQVAELPAACVQLDEANIPGNPSDGPLAAEALNRILRKVKVERAVHFCFGNYGGQSIQKGSWQALLSFLNSLECDHLVLELAHRPKSDLEALKEVSPKIKLGLGVIDIKVNKVESAEDIARGLEYAASIVGEGRIKWVHPDCGFWMLKRSIAERKLHALVAGRDLFSGRGNPA